LSGHGIGLLPSTYCDARLASGELVRLLPDWWSPEIFVHTVYRRLIDAGCAIPAILVTAYPRSSRPVNERLKKIHDPTRTAGKVN
jgi:DNA-binding transcriptional LysR family regulator